MLENITLYSEQERIKAEEEAEKQRLAKEKEAEEKSKAEAAKKAQRTRKTQSGNCRLDYSDSSICDIYYCDKCCGKV